MAGKRRRLAKAFARPLDKKLRDAERVRVTVSVRADEYALLVALQRFLAERGLRVKKSALLCAGLQRLARCSDEEFLGALARLPPLD